MLRLSFISYEVGGFMAALGAIYHHLSSLCGVWSMRMNVVYDADNGGIRRAMV